MNHLLLRCYAVCLSLSLSAFLSLCTCVFVSVSTVDFCIFSCRRVISINVTTIDVLSVYVDVYSAVRDLCFN